MAAHHKPRRVRPASAIAHFSEQLDTYLDEQRSATASLRQTPMPDRPWPSADNPMLIYLLRRAEAIARNEGVDAAMTWLAVHSWFEGALMDRSLSLHEAPAQP